MKCETADITAVVPVRKGSRRLKNKNLAAFAGKSLLEHKIETLKQVSMIKKIVVSSDSTKMLTIAANLGAETHLREREYCDEVSKSFGE
ncbi:MAG: acylneuraminate cytidylyltransferase family protein, partial [Verrucomicrobiota bacterium]